MFLSRLVLNPRSRQARRDAAYPYEMHRTLLRAFPSRVADCPRCNSLDGGFCDDHGPGRVLWRIDIDRCSGQESVLVQSEKQPDWSPVEALDSYLLGAAECKEVNLRFRPGQRLAFRLRANPTVKRDGKRFGLLKEEQQLTYLRNKAGRGGFNIISARTVEEGMAKSHKRTGGESSAKAEMTHFAVRFDGVLEVTKPEAFLTTMEDGIGSAKAFGFGLLSVAQLPVAQLAKL